jgi:hypothetical protein
MRLSRSGRRLALLCRDAPLQIWDLPSRTPLATHFVALPGGATLEWLPPSPPSAADLTSPPPPPPPAAGASPPSAGAAAQAAASDSASDSEELVFAVPDGSLVHVSVRGTRLLSSQVNSGSGGSLELCEGIVSRLGSHSARTLHCIRALTSLAACALCVVWCR